MASDRRSRKGGDELTGKRKQDAAQEQEQEQEQQQKQETETEQARMQNQVGNEGLATLFGIPSVKAGSDAGALDLRDRAEEIGVEFGGDDDLPPDVPGMTLAELTASWNPGIKKSQDRAAFSESMPTEDLPEADKALRAAVRLEPPRQVAGDFSLDALVQPTLRVIAGGMSAWTREIRRWSATGVGRRAWARVITPVAPVLGDPWGRGLVTRTRLAAIGTSLLLDSPSLVSPSATMSAFLQLCLDLSGGEPRVRDVWITAQALGNQLPLAAKLLQPELSGRTGQVRPRELGTPASGHLTRLLTDLLDLPPAHTYLPHLIDDTPPDEGDDPLGLDEVMFANTGGKPDPEAALFDGAVQGAERLAAHAARLRVQLAGTCAAVAQACEPWSSGSPDANLLSVAEHFDERVGKVLSLLVDIARAAQRRSVAIRGLSNGLRRAAVETDAAVAAVTALLVNVIAGVLPEDPRVPPLEPEPIDPLAEAWADGRPAEALRWLATQPDTLDVAAATVFTRAAIAERPSRLVEPLTALRARAGHEGRARLAAAAGSMLGPALLWANQFDRALHLADTLTADALATRNGCAAADGVILGMEAARLSGDVAESERRRRAGASALYWGGNPVGFEILLRWRAPVEE